LDNLEMSKKQNNDDKVYGDYVVRIRPLHYIHVLDTNSNVVKVICGPKKLTCLEHEKVVLGPEKMVIIPPRHYVIIDNPAITEKVYDNEKLVDRVIFDENGQVLLRYGDQEIRFEQEPFPLYAGEKINGTIKKLYVIEEKTAIHLRAKRDFIDRFHNLGEEHIIVERKAGDEWLFRGPGTYLPQIEVDVVSSIKAVILNANQALRLRARDRCLDYLKNERRTGEEWNVNIVGAYLPDVHEEVVGILDGIILTHKKSIHVKALRTFHDRNNIQRKAGTQWLVTRDDCEVFIPDVFEEVIDSNVPLQVITSRQFCMIVDPVVDGKQNFGTKELRRGPETFFLQPGERIEGYQSVQLLSKEEYVKLTAVEAFNDGGNKRKPGDKWLIYGPSEVWMTDEVRQVERGRAFLVIDPLDIYLFSPGLFMLSIVIVIFAYIYGRALIGL